MQNQHLTKEYDDDMDDRLLDMLLFQYCIMKSEHLALVTVLVADDVIQKIIVRCPQRGSLIG